MSKFDFYLNEFTSTTTLLEPEFVEVPEEEELEVASITTKIKWYKHFLSQSSFVDGNCPVLEVANHNEARGWENAFMYKISSEVDGSNSSYYDNRYSFLGCAVPHTYTDGFVPQYQSIWRDDGNGSDEYKFLYDTYGFDHPESPRNTANDNTMNYLLELQLNRDVRVANQNSVNKDLATHENDSLGLDVIRTKIGHMLYGAGNTAPIDKRSWASQFYQADPITFATNSRQLVDNLSEDAGKAINNHIIETFKSYTIANTGIPVGDVNHTSLAQLLINRLREAGSVGTERIAALQESGRETSIPTPWRPILCVGDRIIFNAKFDSSKHATLITRVEIEICDHDNERYDAGADATSSSLLELELTAGTNKSNYYEKANEFSVNEQQHNNNYVTHVQTMEDSIVRTKVGLDRLCCLLECKANETPDNEFMNNHMVKSKIEHVKTKVKAIDYLIGNLLLESPKSPTKFNVEAVMGLKEQLAQCNVELEDAVDKANTCAKGAVDTSRTELQNKKIKLRGLANAVNGPSAANDAVSNYELWGNGAPDDANTWNVASDNEETKQKNAADGWGTGGEYAYSVYWKQTTRDNFDHAVETYNEAKVKLDMLAGAASGAGTEPADDQNVTVDSVEVLRQAMDLAEKAWQAACVAFEEAKTKLQKCLVDFANLEDIFNDNDTFVFMESRLNLKDIMDCIFKFGDSRDIQNRVTVIVCNFVEMMKENVRVKGLEMGRFIKQIQIKYNGDVADAVNNMIYKMKDLFSVKLANASTAVAAAGQARQEAGDAEEAATTERDNKAAILANAYKEGHSSTEIIRLIKEKMEAEQVLQDKRNKHQEAIDALDRARVAKSRVEEKFTPDFDAIVSDIQLLLPSGALVNMDDLPTFHNRVTMPFSEMIANQIATVNELSREQTNDLLVTIIDGEVVRKISDINEIVDLIQNAKTTIESLPPVEGFDETLVDQSVLADGNDIPYINDNFTENENTIASMIAAQATYPEIADTVLTALKQDLLALVNTGNISNTDGPIDTAIARLEGASTSLTDIDSAIIDAQTKQSFWEVAKKVSDAAKLEQVVKLRLQQFNGIESANFDKPVGEESESTAVKNAIDSSLIGGNSGLDAFTEVFNNGFTSLRALETAVACARAYVEQVPLLVLQAALSTIQMDVASLGNVAKSLLLYGIHRDLEAEFQFAQYDATVPLSAIAADLELAIARTHISQSISDDLDHLDHDDSFALGLLDAAQRDQSTKLGDDVEFITSEIEARLPLPHP
jgi:hypothetical protein